MIFWISENCATAQSSSKLVEFCSSNAGDDATYLKDFTVELQAAGPDGRAPFQRATVLLRKDYEYRITVCNADGSEGKGVVQLMDMAQSYGSNYNPATGNFAKYINVQIKKTGPYQLMMSFLDGKKGSAVVIVSFVKTL